MRALAAVLTVAVALEHFGFMALEMAFWTRPLGLNVFHNSPEAAQASAVLAGNQGLYNGFLAAGLLWALWRGGPEAQLFFLGCVVVAGLYGAATALPRILYVQALPAALAFAATLAAG